MNAFKWLQQRIGFQFGLIDNVVTPFPFFFCCVCVACSHLSHDSVIVLLQSSALKMTQADTQSVRISDAGFESTKQEDTPVSPTHFNKFSLRQRSWKGQKS